MRRALALLLLCVALVPRDADAEREKLNQMLSIATPSTTRDVAAHPFVNVVARFGDGEARANPDTFRARLGRVNVTPLFTPIFQNGAITGMRAALGPALLNVGRQRANRLRIEVRGTIGKRQVRDVDRLRFRAVDVADGAPVARALAGSDIVVPEVPLQFDGSQSHDPEDDVLSYLWEFDDGTVSEDPKPVHAFPADETDVTVRLTVSDSQLTSTDEMRLVSCPVPDEGRTAGTLKLEATAALEFGGVALGTSATRTLTVRNADTTETSQLKVRLGTSSAAFNVSTTQLDLGPGESASVDVGFAPAADGHQSAQVTFVASASNQCVVRVLSHGFGGAAPGTGPLPTVDPVFYNTIAQGTYAIRPDGSRFFADNRVHFCQVPQNGAGTGDLCVDDSDCAPNGGTCMLDVTCFRGERAGLPCSGAGDCPGGFCPSFITFDPVDMCGDGEGGVYLMSDEGTFTDPNPGETELAGQILHLKFDAAGNRTLSDIIGLTTLGTTQFACDSIPPNAGGQLYLAEYRAVTSPGNCFRDSREALVARRKSNGQENVLISRIDAAENLDPCDDYDPADDLEVTRDGRAVYAALPAGLYRIRPTTLLMTPDIDDFFQVHPDGGVVVVASADNGPTGLLRIYKISPDQALNGAPHLSDLTPCATIEVPNNRSTGNARLTTFVSFAVGQSNPSTFDGTMLLSFFTNGASSIVSSALRVQGTYAISMPGASNTCTVLGLVNLEPLDQLAF